MHHQSTNIERIIAKSSNEELTEEEQNRLNIWLNQSAENELLYRLFKEQYDQGEQEEIDRINTEEGWHLLQQKMHKGIQVVPSAQAGTRQLYVSIAATIILLAGIGIASWHYLVRQLPIETAIVQTPPAIIGQPGTSKAVLTLADGTVIGLDSTTNGSIALQGNTNIVQLANGSIAYQSANEKPGQLLYNNLVTPVGGQYNLVLPDGSRVWLNAASSLRFPAAFPAGSRSVELTGEAYFEVEHNSAKPFIVQVKKGDESMEIEVLGTRFNVSSYTDEQAIQTVLLQGSVRVKANGKNSTLKPGQQARVNNDDIAVSKADTAKAVAWKNGQFSFNNDNIQTIMNQLARWYNIEPVYQAIPKDRYTGTISRNNNLSEVLQMLKHSGLQFRLEGRKLIIVQ